MPREKIFDEQKVLKDAMDLFWKNGFHKTSIQDLVNYLGVNRATLYNEYTDKEGLFNQCFLLYRKGEVEIISNIFKKAKNIKTGFQQLFNLIVSELCLNSDKRGCLISNTYTEFLPTKRKEVTYLLDETRKIWIDLIYRQLINAKFKNLILIKNDKYLKSLANAIYSSIVGVSILSKTNIKKEELQNSLDLYLNVFK